MEAKPRLVNLKFQMMTINMHFIYRLGIILTAVSALACEKQELPAQPTAGTFALQHNIPASIPKDQAQYQLAIDGSTNGWWVTAPEGVTWITIPRKYGSGSHKQTITFQVNTTGLDRSAWIKVSSTAGNEQMIPIKQEG